MIPSPSRPDYAVPERSGEVFIAPPPDRIGDLLTANREMAWGAAEILGTPLAEFRRRTQARALALAAEYTPGPVPPAERPLIAMGHQPLFFHPGIWMKYFLLTRLCAAHRASGLHLIVDTDASGAITADVPACRDWLVRASEVLVDLPADVPLEAAAPPAAAAWEEFCARVRGDLATLPGSTLRAHADALEAGGQAARRTARTLGEFLAGVRRAYEARAGAPGYLELPMSRLCETPEFRAFALRLLRAPEELRRIYNARLEDYRRAHRLRSAANPFPDLAEEAEGLEMPFWVVRGGRRQALFVRRDGGRLALATAGGPLLSVSPDPAGVDALASLAGAGLAIRPKAMALTMFCRLCLGDLFIHGVAGGRYDQVTDAIIADVFGCRAPAYVVATATLHLAFPASGAIDERHALERRLMDLRHNPDRHLAELSEAQQGLVREKWTLIRAVEAMRPGPERRAATRQIREVNERLADALAPEIARTQARLAVLSQQTDAEEVVHYRGYPFFLFDPAAVGALAESPPCPVSRGG